jgi:ubiquinone/menaquinone biosynthesis C-methylase UbiE
VDHADHVGLIRDGVEGAGRRWLELGAGRGAFTLALADLLGPGAEIVAVDRDRNDLATLAATMARGFPETQLTTVVADFSRQLPVEPIFDGLLAANAFHFVRDPAAVIDGVRPLLRDSARIVVVEYDSDSRNPWVPHPFSFGTWERIAGHAGLTGTRLIGRVTSRFLGAIYAAASEIGSRPVLHSRPHGSDREE